MSYELIYESLSRSKMSFEELEQLLQQARERNEQLGVTGMLVYHNREFIQLLEGNRATVTALFEKISDDPRHGQVRILWEGEIERRGFSRWSMGFLDTRINKSVAEGYSNFLSDGILSGVERSPTVAKRLFVHLRELILKVPFE